MPSVSGELLAGEAQGVVQATGARTRGSIYIYYGVMFGLLGGGALIGDIVAVVMEQTMAHPLFGSGLGVPLGLVAGWLAYVTFARRFLVRRFRRQMGARGLDIRFAYDVRFDDAGMTQCCGGLTKTAAWSAVTDLFKARDYWVFLVQMEPWVVPIRLFADCDEERAFLRDALAYMAPAARDRSSQAVDYAMF